MKGEEVANFEVNIITQMGSLWVDSVFVWIKNPTIWFGWSLMCLIKLIELDKQSLLKCYSVISLLVGSFWVSSIMTMLQTL